MLLGGEGPAGKAWAGRQSSWAGANGLPLPPRTFRVARCFSRRAGSAWQLRRRGAGGREEV